MNNLYDNGTCLLGTKKDIENYSKKLLKDMQEIGDDYVCDTCYMILDTIKDYDITDILYIDYEKYNGMGFDVKCWKQKDILKK